MAYEVYHTYLKNWFESNKTKAPSRQYILKQKYFYLLQQLQQYFTDSEKQLWYNKINLADERELLISIPFFAKKLKTISLYYKNLRKSLKNIKAKYAHVGTKAGLEREIKSYLLETFTNLNTETFPEVQALLPDFASIKDKFDIKVEELYDDFNYFDKSTTVPTTAYYNIFDENTSLLFQTKGIELSSNEWIFKSLDAFLLDDYTTYLAELTGVYEATDINTYGALIQDLLSEKKIQTSFADLSAKVEQYQIPISESNNYFYYPYGSSHAVDIDTRILETPLSGLQIDGATSGKDLKDSDTMFVKTGNVIKGAWLRYIDFEDQTKQMWTKIKEDAATTFIFPYPGYGLSAEDVEWTGFSLSATEEYNFLSKALKSAIDQKYWSESLPKDTCSSIPINSTALVSNGAYAHKNPNNADQIFVYPEKPENPLIPYNESSGAWLYYFDRTSIPIASGITTSEGVLVWPLEIMSSKEDTFPERLKAFDFNSLCNPTPLSSLEVPFAVASNTFDTAEKIYKVTKYTDVLSDATECCWLSGKISQNNVNQWFDRQGFSCYLEPGRTTSFIWNGPDNTPLDKVFIQTKHSPDCEYFVNNLSVNSVSSCECKQVYYSPYGHPGETFDADFAGADYIIYDPSSPDVPFDFAIAQKATNKFAWFKTKERKDWGNGNWVFGKNGKEQPFLLETGKKYTYNRTNSKQEVNFPPYIINHKFEAVDAKPKWIQARKNQNNEWVSTGIESTTELQPGDLLKWDRPETSLSYYLSAYQTANTTTLLSSIWTTNDVIALGSEQSTCTVFWPFTIIETDSYDPQIPRDGNGDAIPFSGLLDVVYWKVTNQTTGEVNTLYNVTSFTFAPTTTGTYTFEVQAKINSSASGLSLSSVSLSSSPGQNIPSTLILPQINSDTTTITFNAIPPIYVVPQYRTEYTPVPVTQPTAGYLLEQPLYGWDYANNRSNKLAQGAKPYWASLYFDKNETTRYKGVHSWGYPKVYYANYLPYFTPLLSPLVLDYGNVITYNRKGLSLIWIEPLTYKTYVGKSQWSKLTSNISNASSLSSIYEINKQDEPAVKAEKEPTDIVLTNFANGFPVEIYYYALNSYVWNVSALIPQASSIKTDLEYFANPNSTTVLSNRFYPTIAVLPVAEGIYSEQMCGGYFTPQLLGASQYIGQKFTPLLSGSYVNTTILTEDTNSFVGGRGLSKQDQKTIYRWEENSDWLKEPPTSDVLSGSVKKEVSKLYQTFVPYKSIRESKQPGLLTPSNRTTPWGGSLDSEWTDSNNNPASFTGVYNVSAWSDLQYLKKTKSNMECWVSDVFGNQYGVFKETLSSHSLLEKSTLPGELWVRTSQDKVLPASVALSSITSFFYNTTSNSIYTDLTHNGVTEVDCLYDTLTIKTSSCTLITKIDYDYDTGVISSSYDNMRVIELKDKEIFGQTWVLSEQRMMWGTTARLTATQIEFNLLEVDLTSLSLKTTFTTLVTGVLAKNIENCLINYNADISSILVTINGKDITEAPYIVDLLFKLIADKCELVETTIYTSQEYKKLPEFNSTAATFYTLSSNFVNLQLQVENSPSSFELLNYKNELTLTQTGLLTGTLTSTGLHFVNFQVTNEAGSCTFGITLSCN